MKGDKAIWMGICTSPQYQEISVNARSEAGKATGNANLPNVFLNEGNNESLQQRDDDEPAQRQKRSAVQRSDSFPPSSFVLIADLILGITQSPKK